MKKCKYCSSDIDNNAKICPNCRKRQSYKSLYITLIVIAGIILIVGISIFMLLNIRKDMEEKTHKSKNEAFHLKVTSFEFKYLSESVDLEAVANDVKTYWYDSIWNDKYNNDINEAIDKALKDNADKIEEIKNSKNEITTMYNEILKADCYSIYCQDIKNAVKNAYNTYIDFYDLSISPSGNYNSYSNEFSTIDSDAINNYNELNNLLDLFNK